MINLIEVVYIFLGCHRTVRKTFKQVLITDSLLICKQFCISNVFLVCDVNLASFAQSGFILNLGSLENRPFLRKVKEKLVHILFSSSLCMVNCKVVVLFVVSNFELSHFA